MQQYANFPMAQFYTQLLHKATLPLTLKFEILGFKLRLFEFLVASVMMSFFFQTASANANMQQYANFPMAQFYIQLLHKATLRLTLRFEILGFKLRLFEFLVASILLLSNA